MCSSGRRELRRHIVFATPVHLAGYRLLEIGSSLLSCLGGSLGTQFVLIDYCMNVY